MRYRNQLLKFILAPALFSVLLLAGVVSLASPAGEDTWPDHTRANIIAQVIWIADGDTIVIDTGKPAGGAAYHLIDGIPIYRYERVRFVGGINTPEIWGRPAGEPEAYAYEAKWANWRLLAGREVRLEIRPERPRDGFGRLLAYVYVEYAGEWIMVNAELIRRGLGELNPRFHLPEDRYYEYLWQMQIEALVARQGVWGRFPEILTMEDLIADPVKYMEEAVTIRFIVTETRAGRRRRPGLYIHGESPREFNFRLLIPEKRLSQFEQIGMGRNFWQAGMEVTVTGVVVWDRGLFINLESPLQIDGVILPVHRAERAVPTTQQHQPVQFADPNLELVIRETIGRPSGPIYRDDLIGVTFFAAEGRNITDLAGIEHLVDLRVLHLARNHIQDLTPLAALVNLQELVLSRNQISDLTPLTTLTRLRYLSLGVNRIYDLSPLAALTQLEELSLIRNRITDLTPLAKLTKLRSLVLSVNQISDLAPLAKLSQLTQLYAAENQIGDVSSLATLTRLRQLDLRDNDVNDIVALAGLTELTHLQLIDNQISDIAPLSALVELRVLHLCRNPVAVVEPLSRLVRLEELLLGWTGVSDIRPLAGLTELRRLNLGWNRISDISPLSALERLEQLWLYWNQIEDITALENLLRLEQLALRSNQITEIATLAGLVRLEWLGLAMNRVTDITALAGLTRIRELSLSYNQITDITPLADNIGLATGDTIFLGNNPLDRTPGSPTAEVINELLRRGVSVR